MEAVQDVKSEVKEVNADSSVNDILAKASSIPDTEAEGAVESPAKEQVAEGAEESGKDVKTEEPKVADEDVDAGLEEGQPIPYDRFKKVNEERKAAKSELESFKKKAEEAQELFSDPDVLRVIRKKQGYTDEAIAEELKEMGVEEKVEGEEVKPDLTTVDGWQKLIDKRIDERLGKEINPIKKTLTESQQKEQMAQFNTRIEAEGKEAAKLAKDVYGLEYGDEKDAKDPTTAVGKMFNYLQKYPQKASLVAQGFLSKSDLLRLAVAEDGVKLGEKKGEANVKARTEKVKSAQMEGDAGTSGADTPQADWSTQRISEYMKTHPNWHP